MLKFKPAKIHIAVATALALGVAASLSVADSFTANRTVVHPGETLELTYTADQSGSQDIYLALSANNALLFMNENGGFSPYVPGAPTPARLRTPAAGSHTLLSFTMPDGFFMNLTAYQVAGRPGGDLLAPGNFDPTSLRALNLSFVQGTTTPTPTPSASGRSLYSAHCAACHGENPASNIYNILRGTNPQTTIAAINTDKGGMGYLSTLTGEENNAIAAWISNPI